MLWIAFAAMLLAGALFVCWPLYRAQRRLTPGLALGAIGVRAPPDDREVALIAAHDDRGPVLIAGLGEQ